jgi:serine/threonine-protein phosphatase 4 regulatory subunit 1
MTKVNQYIGDEQTEKLFLDRFLDLCKSQNLFVRKMCASIIGEFCTIMSKETITNKLVSRRGFNNYGAGRDGVN